MDSLLNLCAEMLYQTDLKMQRISEKVRMFGNCQQ